MNLLYIVNHLPPKIDGVGDYTSRLLDSLRLSSTNIQLYIATKNNSEITDFTPHNAKIFQFRTWSVGTWLSIFNTLRKEKINVLHLQYVPYSFNKYGTPLLLPIALLLLRLLTNTRIITTFHEVRIKREFRKNIIVSILQGIIAKYIYIACHETITSNLFYKNLIWKNGRTEILPIGSNITPMSLDIEKNKIIPSANKFVIVSFGSGIKSYKIILESVALLTTKINNIELKFIGNINAEELKNIHNLAKDLNIEKLLKITGYLPSEHVYIELLKANVYLMFEDIYKPSSWKGLSFKSGTFAAALSAGLPVIAFKGELTDRILSDLSFITFVSENIYKIKNAIYKLYLKPEEFCTKHDIYNFYEENLSFKVIAKQQLKIYLNVCKL